MIAKMGHEKVNFNVFSSAFKGHYCVRMHLNTVCSLFGEFVNAHCRLRQGAWVELTMLHTAFADFCVLRGAGVEWVKSQ
jgi:hypothetical protein